MKLHELDALIRAVCPIHGVSSDGRIHFKDEATEAQKVAAEAVVVANLAKV